MITYVNPNEITKSEWDELVKSNTLDIFSKEQVETGILALGDLLKKSETLTEEEEFEVNVGKAELANLTAYTVVDKVEGRLVKSNFFVQPKQVEWEDTLEKSENGETIKKGIFLDTELNRTLNRVGEELIKGKKVEPEKKKEESKPEFDEEMYKSAMDLAKKSMDKKSIYKGLIDNNPDGDKNMMKACTNKAYGAMAKSYMEKADEDDFGDEDEENEEEKSKK